MASVAAPRKQTNPGRRKDEPRGKHGGPRSGAGRPTKRTPAVEQALLQGITLGLSLSRACALVGITSETFAEWCENDQELAQRVEQARAKGIECALRELHSLKKEGDSRAITWFLEKMDRAAYGPQPAVVNAQQNNYLPPATTKHAGAVEIADFITAQRQRLALARSIQESDPERAAEILSETIDIDSEADLLDRDEPEHEASNDTS